MSQSGDIKTRALYKDVSDFLESGTSSLAYSRALRDDALLYRSFRDGDSDDEDLQDFWTALRTLKANSAYALLLAAHRHPSGGESKRLARSLVALAVRHNIVCNLDRARFETTIYAACKGLSNGQSFDQTLESLRAISPDEQRFRASFRELSFSQPEHSVARYLLKSIEAHLAPTKELAVSGSNKVHVEHICPQSPTDAMRWPEHKIYVNRIGNLTLLDKRLNETIKNAPFADKKQQAYSTSRLEITKALSSLPDEWTPEEVQMRSARLYEVAAVLWPQTLA